MPVPRFGQNLRLHQSPGCLPLFAGTLKNCDLPCAGMGCPDRVRASRVARERRVFWRGAMGKNQPGKLIALVWIAYRDSFVLKGALLFELWTKDRHRPKEMSIFSLTDRMILNGSSPTWATSGYLSVGFLRRAFPTLPRDRWTPGGSIRTSVSY
jgi:hypothetical protein